MQLKTTRGYALSDVASALQKTIRRGDARLAGYFAIEMFCRPATCRPPPGPYRGDGEPAGGPAGPGAAAGDGARRPPTPQATVIDWM